MSALVERIIAARDRLKGFAVPSDDDIIEARNAMADAANALTAPVDWGAVAEEALGVMKAAANVAAKKAADEIYARILDSTQDYLADNLRFNIASTLETAERERKAAQDRVGGLLALVGEQHAALKWLLSEWDALGHGDDQGEPVADQHPSAVRAREVIAKAEARQ